ncbi:MAG: sulfite exporter TauE/SafE family protein, partial [Actinomycetes bacterium]
MELDWWITLGAFVVGTVVGLTGMGGGALMTPMLVVFFNVPPLAAVSSDLVAAAVMKPVGGGVHIRKGTVNFTLVKYLAIGSVPSAFCGVLVIKALGNGARVENYIQMTLGIALLMAAFGLAAKTYLNLAARAKRYARGEFVSSDDHSAPVIHVRPLQTVLIGVVGGLVVGMTSVGSGSLMIVALLILYPMLNASQLVGTDLVQAVPLVFSAALGHLLFGDVQFGITLPLLLGAVPGAYLGARISSSAPQGIIRRVLAIVLSISGLKLLGVSTEALAYVIIAIVLLGPALWMLIR